MIKDLEDLMDIEGIERQFHYTLLKGRIKEPLEEHIQAIKKFFSQLGYFAVFEKEGEKHIVRYGHITHRVLKPPKKWINLMLFIATVITTLWAGSLHQLDISSDTMWGGLLHPFINPSALLLGIPFSFSILLILGCHELGHYFTCKRFGIDATLPYFLPVPHPLLGTMGAVIRIRSIIPNRKALVWVGVSGPIIGFLLAIPITIIGLKLSILQPLTELEGGIGLGSSLIFWSLSKLVFPHIPPGYDITLHSVAFAGWIGFFVTAMNLLPLGQLDGGHIVYALFKEYRKYITFGVIALLVFLGLSWPGWWFWVALILLLGMKHSRTQDEIIPLGKREKGLALLALSVFLLSFVPVPFLPLR